MSMEQSVAERFDALDQGIFDDAATWAARQINRMGHAFIDLQPGDATTYKIAIVCETRVSQNEPVPDRIRHMWVATSFGQMYPFSGQGGYDWGYVMDHWLPYHPVRSQTAEWTARVIARFLNTLSDKLKEG